MAAPRSTAARSDAWTWRHAVARSDLKATTKLVLLTISLHMNELGENAFASQETIATEASLSRKAVVEHIGIAVKKGWLVARKHGFAGRRWNHNEYRPRWPERDLLSATEFGGNGKLHPSNSEAVTVAGAGCNSHGNEAVTEGYTNGPDNIPDQRSSARTVARGPIGGSKSNEPLATKDDYDDVFDELSETANAD